MEVEAYRKRLEEMEDVANLQTEVADLDRCIAWSEPLDLRAEVHQLTAAIEEQLPKEVEEVGGISECLLSCAALETANASAESQRATWTLSKATQLWMELCHVRKLDNSLVLAVEAEVG